MKRRLSTIALWLLIAILPLNAAATRFACCWPGGGQAMSECEQHRGAGQPAKAPVTKHRALAAERCSHCSLCCAPTPALPNDVLTVAAMSTVADAQIHSEVRYSNRVRDRLDRPPKSLFS